MRQSAADKKLTQAGTYFHFQGGAAAELFMPENRALDLTIRNDRTEQE